MSTTIRACYGMWPQYNRRLRDLVGALPEAELEIRPSESRWPIWATVAHTVAARVYWLCHVVGEPGADATPFRDPGGFGWEDDLERPRDRAELLHAIDSTWRIADACLDRWTIAMLDDPIRREMGGSVQVHTRGSIMQRLLTHEAYHSGELSQTLGIHNLPQIDLWASEAAG